MATMRIAALMALAGVAACSLESEQNQAAEPAGAEAAVAENRAAQPVEPSPPLATPSRTPEEAASVLRRYFALVGAGRYSDAYRLWTDHGRGSGISESDFIAGLERYRTYRGTAGEPGRMEAAAGSVYVEVPAIVRGTLMSGESVRLSGPVTLRRANDVPGSTDEQRQWRIYRMDLRPAGQATAYRFIGRWATEERNCASRAWRFTADRLTTPAGSVCRFRQVTEVPGGYDIAARCTAEGPATSDTLKLRFAESARALLFESRTIADAGLVRCR